MLPSFNEANRAAAINTNIFLNSLVLNNYLILSCDVLKWQFLSLKSQALLCREGSRENHFVCLLCAYMCMQYTDGDSLK